MTWSIVAYDPATSAFGVTVATRAFAVGASCPFVRAGVGAVSTQSITNRYLGPAILDGLARGLSPAAAIEGALVGDDGLHLRQVHAIDCRGRSAAWTGKHCVEWCGDRPGQNVHITGNMLAGAATLDKTLIAFEANATLPLPERMMLAIEAGELAGGDKRGRQSAAMIMTTTEDFPDLNIRVDDAPMPLQELRRLLELWRVSWPARHAMSPSKARPSGITDIDAIEAGWRAQGLELQLRR